MRINLRTKLLIQFLLIGIVPATLVSVIAYQSASDSLRMLQVDSFNAVSATKRKAVENYFTSIAAQIRTLSEDTMVVDATAAFSQFVENYGATDASEVEKLRGELKQYYTGQFGTTYEQNNSGKAVDVGPLIGGLDSTAVVMQHRFIQANSHPLGSKHLMDDPGDGTQYASLHQQFHPILRHYLEEFGYYDIFLVDGQSGRIVYSVFKELDYATSLKSGPYAGTDIAKVYKQAMAAEDANATIVTDYAQYLPSYDSPASFIASPIIREGSKIGVLIFQMPLDRINGIMQTRDGMGKTGETLMVGSDHLPRSDSFLDTERYSVGAAFRNAAKSEIKLQAVSAALSGETGYFIEDSYTGQEAVVAYTPVDALGYKWALLALINTDEAFARVTALGEWMVVVGLISGLIVCFLGFYIGRSIARPILGLAGDLGEDSQKVAEASDSLAISSGKLSSVSAEQAASLEETAASIEEISAMVNNNVAQAENSSQLSQQVKDVADRGNDSMTQLVASMQDITESNEKIQDLVKVIGEIGEKTGVIDEIVFQTKLLSFNASVEAERAGEHGRGFAVVAQEVGNLAQMSGKAAAEIADMVKASIKNAQAITSENKTKVESGNSLVNDTAAILQEIAADATTLLAQAQQISTASKEQAAGINQVNEAMAQLDQATQTTTANAESTANSSVSLAGNADSLRDNVASLLVVVEGKGGGELPVAASSDSEEGPAPKATKVTSINKAKEKKAAKKAKEKAAKKAAKKPSTPPKKRQQTSTTAKVTPISAAKSAKSNQAPSEPAVDDGSWQELRKVSGDASIEPAVADSWDKL